jgi:hypothetical protein
MRHGSASTDIRLISSLQSGEGKGGNMQGPARAGGVCRSGDGLGRMGVDL